MELIEKIKRALCDNSPFDDDKPDDYKDEAQTVLTALIEHAGGDGVTEGDRELAYFMAGRSAREADFKQAARHRATAFAAGKAARGREIVAWLRGDADTLEREDTAWNAAYLAEAIRECADAIERGEV